MISKLILSYFHEGYYPPLLYHRCCSMVCHVSGRTQACVWNRARLLLANRTKRCLYCLLMQRGFAFALQGVAFNLTLHENSVSACLEGLELLVFNCIPIKLRWWSCYPKSNLFKVSRRIAMKLTRGSYYPL